MTRIGLYAVLALGLSIGSVSAQTAEEGRNPVRAKEPTVVEVYGKRGQVDLDQTANKAEAKRQNAAKRMAMKVVNGVGYVWNAAFDWTEKSLGVDDDIDNRKNREVAK